ncbi:hypothetical protein [Melittangium boletus]|uniref:hypothetical protein n=1 Tax=Melittangium boletus TaxID=83453 RepID=UPI003DA6989D
MSRRRACPPRGPRPEAARFRERERAFAPPELIDVEGMPDDASAPEDEGEPSRALRLVRAGECASEPAGG